MTPEEMEREEEQLAPWAQAGWEAYLRAMGLTGSGPSWDEMDAEARHPWVKAADAVLDGYDEEWQSRKAGY